MLADIRGVTINYEVSGNENGPWLTFSNSLATNLGMWDEQEAALSNDFRILRYDKRGHGKSAPVEGPYSFDDLIDDIVGLWDRLGIEESYFVGLSIGGMTAQGLSLRHADRVAATVMANTTAHCSDGFHAAFDQRVAAVADGGMEAVVESTIERWFSERYRASGAARLEDVRTMIRTTSVAGYTGCARAIQGLEHFKVAKNLDCVIRYSYKMLWSMTVGVRDGASSFPRPAATDRVGGGKRIIVSRGGGTFRGQRVERDQVAPALAADRELRAGQAGRRAEAQARRP